MTKQGWVALYRKIQDHWLWEDKPFSKGQAWIDLLLLANHEDKKVILGNEIIDVEAGSFITSELKLMERWGWGKAKTRNFLDLLQNDEMILKKSDHKKTTITIVKYSDYAVLKTTSGPQTDCEQTDSRPQADTNNNDNNDNNNNNYFHSSILADKEAAKREYLGGTLGKGVVFMSDEQFDDLCEKLSYDELNYYFGVIAECELNGKKFKRKTHYQAILDMVTKDRKTKN